MEYSVSLASLPEKVAIPDRLRERMSFDAAKQKLTYRGFMTKCTYDELATLDDDADYRRALEQLFVLTSREIAPQPHSRGLSGILLVTAALALLAAAVFWAATHSSQAGPRDQISTATVSAAS
jgi:hypothetical protein